MLSFDMSIKEELHTKLLRAEATFEEASPTEEGGKGRNDTCWIGEWENTWIIDSGRGGCSRRGKGRCRMFNGKVNLNANLTVKLFLTDSTSIEDKCVSIHLMFL